jgi:hypothetical protein
VGVGVSAFASIGVDEAFQRRRIYAVTFPRQVAGLVVSPERRPGESPDRRNKLSPWLAPPGDILPVQAAMRELRITDVAQTALPRASFAL